MSEKTNDPEQKKPKAIYDDCANCEKRYKITGANSAVYEYTKQPDCTFMLCVCPNCSNQMKIFISEETLTSAKENGLAVLQEPYPDDDTYNQWLELCDITPAPTYELTGRHEVLLGKFATTLGSMPDDLLYDLITDDNQGRPHPGQWT